MKKLSLLLAIAIVSMLSITAQTAPPVCWRTVVRMADNTEGTVTFKAIVSEGWHLYSTSLPEGGPRPTSIELSGEGIEITGDITPSRAPLQVEDPMFGMTLSWWDSDVSFSVPVRLTGPEDGKVKATIRYMTCDGSSCRPPATENIVVPVRRRSN